MTGQAAAIQAALSEAGLSAVGVGWWWREPHPRLEDGLSPRALIDRDGAAAGERLLALAREDVFGLAHELPGADELAAAAVAVGCVPGPLSEGRAPLHAPEETAS